MTRIVLIMFVGSVLVSAVQAGQEPTFTNVFTAGEGGYFIYRIPGLVVTAKGTLLAYCEARKNGRSDWGMIDIMYRRSTDGGRTFSPARQLATVPGPHSKNPAALAQKLGEPGSITYNNPVAISEPNGLIHMLFCLEYMRCFYVRSEDDGQTFSAPVEITPTFEAFRSKYPWKVLATGPGHGIRLTSGRLLVPVWLSTGTGGSAHRPSCVATIFSDDGGKTWKAGEIVVDDGKEFVNPNETCAAQLSDGRVMLNIRNQSPQHRRLVSTSPDGASRWSKPQFDDALLEPICMASLLKLGGSKLLFANPDNLKRTTGVAKPGQGRDRINLSLKLSLDDGKTWSYTRVLEPKFSAYSDLAAGPDGALYCFFERGSTDDKTPITTKFLTLARFSEAWLTATSP